MTHAADIADPGLDDLLDVTVRQVVEAIAGPVPAKVTAYDAATQRCSAKPLVMVPRNGALTTLKVLQEVPVLWPSGGGWSLVGPMAAGDFVWLVPAGADVGQWVASGAENSPAASQRSHNMSDVVAIPGSRPVPSPLPSTAWSAAGVVLAGNLLLGDSTATEFVALATKVLTELQAIASALGTHTHAGVLTGGGTSGAPAAPPYTAPVSVGASKVKAK